MVVRSPICRKGSLWGLCRGPGHPLSTPSTSVYSALSTLAGHRSVTRNTAANQTHKEAALMKLTVWRREARLSRHMSRVSLTDSCWRGGGLGAVGQE